MFDGKWQAFKYKVDGAIRGSHDSMIETGRGKGEFPTL
jgi:hypothetical protein